MPWWAMAYLVILAMVIFVSIIKVFYERRSFAYISGEFVSGALGFIFIVGYWKEDLAGLISWLVIPLLIYAIAWDQYALSKMKKSAYPDLTEQENKDMDKYSRLFALIFISPCYLAGGLLSYRLINF